MRAQIRNIGFTDVFQYLPQIFNGRATPISIKMQRQPAQAIMHVGNANG